MRLRAHPPTADRDRIIAELAREVARFDACAERFGVVTLRAGGAELDAGEPRASALTRARAGELMELEVDVVAYVQMPGAPNRKHRRMAPKAMQKLASSFVGRPVLRDHAHDQVDARAGTIIASTLEREELADGGTRYTIRQTFSLVKQWAIVGVLDGTLDATSISWFATEPVKCSVHETEIFTDCYCFPGDRLEAKGGGETVVEWVYGGADGLETSFVNVPAVVETQVDRVRELALSLDSAGLAGILDTKKERTTMDPRLAAVLMLAATASIDDAIGAATRLNAERAQARDELAIAREKLATFEAADQARAEVERKKKIEADKLHIDEAIADLTAKGKLIPGGESETALRSIGARDLASFDAQVADYHKAPPVTPVGRGALPPAPPVTGADDALAANPTVKEYMKAAGITKEQFEKFGLPRLREIQTPA